MTPQPADKILCLCATYGRPTLLANTLACYLAQDYPSDKRHLLILDDAGQYKDQVGDGWTLVSLPARLSLPKKYQAMLRISGILPHLSDKYQNVAIWDDDDIYLPNHLSSHMDQLDAHMWSYPAEVYKLDTPGLINTENPQGNLWASTAFRADLLRRIGGFTSEQASFDLQLLGAAHSVAPPGRSPNRSFMFRWQSTGAPHLQSCITNPLQTDHFVKFRQYETHYVDKLVPKLDSETEDMLLRFSAGSLQPGPY